MGKPFFVYILLCTDGSYYVGHTDDLDVRLYEHEQGGKCVYTSSRRPIKLVWSQEFVTREDARDAEARIKKWSRKKKEALLRGDFASIGAEAKKRNWQA